MSHRKGLRELLFYLDMIENGSGARAPDTLYVCQDCGDGIENPDNTTTCPACGGFLLNSTVPHD